MNFVTGGSGLLGKALIVHLLEAGEEVHALQHNTPIDLQHPNLTITSGDLLDVHLLQDVLQDVQYVYHCAGYVSYAPNKSSLLYKLNVEATANLVNASLQAGIKKMVHVSSVSALPQPDAGMPVTEGDAWKAPHKPTPYGKSKWLGEMEVWRGIAEGLNAVIVNPSIILGDGDWNQGSSALFRSAYRSFPWYSDGVTGYVDARDVVKAMVMLMKSEWHSERFVVSAENKSYREILHGMAHHFQTRAAHKKVTPFLAGIVWRLEQLKAKFSGKDPMVTKHTARQALIITRYDSSKLLKALPHFAFRSIDETIRHFCTVLKQKVNNQ